jgi:hypothetical protein
MTLIQITTRSGMPKSHLTGVSDDPRLVASALGEGGSGGSGTKQKASGACRKLRAAMAILVAAGVVAVFTTNARAQNIRMRADIPFGFHVQDKVFEAGSYWIQVHRQAMAGGFFKRLEIGSASPKSDVVEQFNLAAGIGYRPENAVPNGKLVFDNLGGVYALRTIWLTHEAEGSIVPMTKTERELALKATRRNSIELAAN